MKPSRMSKSLKEQNWASVAIDLVLVTISVLIALQLGQFAQSREDQRSLRGALERLEEETQTNIAIMDHYLVRYDRVRDATDIGRMAIQTCDPTPEAAAQVAESIAYMTVDLDPTFITLTAEELSRQARYLDRLSPEFRVAFNRFQATLAEDNDQTTVNFQLIWDNRVFNHPAMTADLSAEPLTTPVELSVPLSVLCEDNEFRRRYFMTTALIAGLGARINGLKGEAEAFREALSAERDRQG